MYSFVKMGDKEVCKPVEMPDGIKSILLETLEQNRMILKANCRIIDMISSPIGVFQKSGHQNVDEEK